jgi:hypothetical protein
MKSLDILQFIYSFQLHYSRGVYSASNRNECKAPPARKAENLTAISEPIV